MHSDCWSGSTWTIEDENELAKLIANVAIGQSRTVERILRATGDLPARYPKGGFAGACKLLTVGTSEKTYHRDGWIFQVIAWIAAHRFDDEALIRAPQMIKVDKGLDGLIIEFGNDGIAHVVICEEKATKNPRKQVKSKVWQEFEQFETGERDNELIASVTSLLVSLCPYFLDADRLDWKAPEVVSLITGYAGYNRLLKRPAQDLQLAYCW